MHVNEVMHAHPVTVQRDQAIASAASLLTRLGVRHLPVMSGTRLLGVLSDRDFRSAVDNGLDEAGAHGEPNRTAGALAVEALVSGEPITIAPNASVREAVDLICEHRVGALPVMDSNKVLVGIVSYIDLLKELRTRL